MPKKPRDFTDLHEFALAHPRAKAHDGVLEGNVRFLEDGKTVILTANR